MMIQSGQKLSIEFFSDEDIEGYVCTWQEWTKEQMDQDRTLLWGVWNVLDIPDERVASAVEPEEDGEIICNMGIFAFYSEIYGEQTDLSEMKKEIHSLYFLGMLLHLSPETIKSINITLYVCY